MVHTLYEQHRYKPHQAPPIMKCNKNLKMKITPILSSANAYKLVADNLQDARILTASVEAISNNNKL